MVGWHHWLNEYKFEQTLGHKCECKFWGLYGGLMATSSKRAYAKLRSAAPRAPAPDAGHCWPIPPQDTLRLSLCGVSWWAQGFVWALGISLVGMGFDSKHHFVPPTVLLGFLLCIFIPIPKKGNAKEYSNYCTTALISHASKVMLKVLQDRLQQYVNCELPHVQAGFTKGRGIRDWIANIHWIIEKSKRVLEKHLLLLCWLCQSLWLCGSQQTVENSSRDGNTRPPDLLPEKSVCRSGSNS